MHVFVFEGIDGSGKTSVINKVTKKLNESNIHHVYVRMPSRTKLGRRVYDLLSNSKVDTDIAEAFVDDFNQTNNYLKSLKEGEGSKETVVIIDRYVLSFLAYQIQILGQDLGSKMFSKIKNIQEVSKVFMLDVDPKISVQRLAHAREKLDTMEERGEEFLSGVRENYMKISKNYDSIIIDATDSVESIANRCVNEIEMICSASGGI